MTDPDTPDSVQADAPSGQAPPAGETSPAEKDSDRWVTGDEPMTGPQASYLETLAQQAGEQVPENLTKSEASRAIQDLQQKVGRAG